MLLRLLSLAALAAFGLAACASGIGIEPTSPPTTTLEPTRSAVTNENQDPEQTAPLQTLPPGAAVCDGYADVATDGALNDANLNEISGVTASRRFKDVLWMHNDSRGGANIYAVSTDGTLRATWQIDGATAFDWEDMSSGPGPEPGINYLYVGDIGDNFALRSEIVVYRFPEPDPSRDGVVRDIEVFRLSYPEPGADAEALAVDPVSGDLIVITKDREGPEIVYRAPGSELRDGLVTRLEPVATIDLGGNAEVTAADFSPQGERVAFRGYNQIWMWPRLDEDLTSTFAEEPCRARSPKEKQGEALGFDVTGVHLFTVSEGTGAAVNRIGTNP